MPNFEHTVYILHSKSLNRNYVGYTSMELTDRIRRHKSNHKGFTGRAEDWELVYSVGVKDKLSALRLERKIKSRGAFRYLSDKHG